MKWVEAMGPETLISRWWFDLTLQLKLDLKIVCYGGPTHSWLQHSFTGHRLNPDVHPLDCQSYQVFMVIRLQDSKMLALILIRF